MRNGTSHELNWNSPRWDGTIRTYEPGDVRRLRGTVHVEHSLARAGVPMMTGTDLPNAVLVPGFSLHGELDALSLAGLTNYQVLEAATSAPARFLRQETDWGRVAVGQRANLILANDNPLKNLHTLRDPAGVILGGQWISGADLRKMRKQ